MSQRDCGCPGLATSTLDELLAVAQQKPLPRVRVRERRAPPARVGATMKGWLSWQLIDRAGREVRAGEGPNLILDQGLDQIAATELLVQRDTGLVPPSYFPLIRYAAVGTDSTAPDPSQTGLGAEIARTDAAFAEETITRPSPGVYQLTRFIEFDYSVANGNLTEWGFSNSGSSGSNLFNRALFTDGGGTPDAVTKTDQEKLRLAYTLEVTLSPVALTEGSFSITGVGTVNGEYTLIGSSAPSSRTQMCKAPDLVLFSHWARGHSGTTVGISQRPETGSIRAESVDRSSVTYSTTLSDLTDNELTVARDIIEERDAYVPGSFERTGGAWRFDTGYGNLDPIRAFLVTGASEIQSGGTNPCMVFGYVFALDSGSEFSKDDEHALTIGVPTVSWGRGSS